MKTLVLLISLVVGCSIPQSIRTAHLQERELFKAVAESYQLLLDQLETEEARKTKALLLDVRIRYTFLSLQVAAWMDVPGAESELSQFTSEVLRKAMESPDGSP